MIEKIAKTIFLLRLHCHTQFKSGREAGVAALCRCHATATLSSNKPIVWSNQPKKLPPT
jgi:hypothetical protein